MNDFKDLLKALVIKCVRYAPDMNDLPSDQRKCVDDIVDMSQKIVEYQQMINPKYLNPIMMCALKRIVLANNLLKQE